MRVLMFNLVLVKIELHSCVAALTVANIWPRGRRVTPKRKRYTHINKQNGWEKFGGVDPFTQTANTNIASSPHPRPNFSKSNNKAHLPQSFVILRC